MALTAAVSFHWIKSITARSTYTTGAPLILNLAGEDGTGGEITIFTDNADLTARLIEAINSVNAPKAEAEAA